MSDPNIISTRFVFGPNFNNLNAPGQAYEVGGVTRAAMLSLASAAEKQGRKVLWSSLRVEPDIRADGSLYLEAVAVSR